MNIGKFIFLLVLILSFSIQAYCQQESQITMEIETENGVQKNKLVIRETGGDSREFSWTGEEIPADIQEELDKLNIRVDQLEQGGKTVIETKKSVEIRKNPEVRREVRMIVKDGNGEKVIEWNGEGEMPEELKKMSGSDDLTKVDKNRIVIKKGNGEEQVLEWSDEEIPESIREEISKIDPDLLSTLDLEKKEKTGGFLGLGLAQNQITSKINGLETVVRTLQVAEVVPGSPAEMAGVKAEDIIEKINGIAVQEASPFLKELQNFQPGQKIMLSISRNDEKLEIPVVLGE